MNKIMTGYPSIDKPWLKYYTEEQINAPLPHMTAYEYLRQQNAGREDLQAIDSAFGNYTYCELFGMIDRTLPGEERGEGKGRHAEGDRRGGRSL